MGGTGFKLLRVRNVFVALHRPKEVMESSKIIAEDKERIFTIPH